MDNARIKFRQPRIKADGTFCYWHYWGYVDGNEDVFVCPLPPTTGGQSHQWTGLTDKKGVDIYEGDIIQFHPLTGTTYVVNMEDDDPLRKIVWRDIDQGRWSWKRLDGVPEATGYSFCKRNAENIMEVIGNIYENRKLLNGK